MKKSLKYLLIITFILLITPRSIEASANFDKFLKDGKLVINGVEPQDENEASDRFSAYFYKLGEADYQIAPASCDDTFTTCYLVYNLGKSDQEDLEVQITYNYDKNIKKVIDNLVSKMGNQKTFKLTDMEIINYFLYGGPNSTLSNFSQDFRKAIDYKNFELDVRGGDETPFYKENIGIAEFTYDNTLYYYQDGIGVIAQQVIYIEDDASDIKSAIKKRITDTFGNIDIEVLDGYSITSYLESEKNKAIAKYNDKENSYLKEEYATAEEYAESYRNEYYYDSDAYYHCITSNKILDNYYIIKINGEEYNFAVIKDSSKINNNITYSTIDINSNVEINTTSTLIPLDTLISVAKLTSGTEYDRIIKALSLNNAEMFDLKLFSKSSEDYITKLSNGTFEVKIPISREMQNKELIAYYVDDNNKVTEYKATVENGYAKFNTDHFSIYTLGYKEPTKEEKNPQTFDGIKTSIIIGMLSLVGLIGTSMYLKKNH